LLDTHPVDTHSLEKFFANIKGDELERQYKEHLSDYPTWKPKSHAKDWLLFPENVGRHMSIDETALSDGELYTIFTNKEAHGKRGALAAIVSGTDAKKVEEVLCKLTLGKRALVEEVTLDMSGSMEEIVKYCFPNAVRTVDRFHVQKLACDALQEMRIAHRWDAINEETNAKEQAKLEGRPYKPVILENGDSPKQLLARSRYLLFKSPNNWTGSQIVRAGLLFERYPDMEKAFSLTHSLRMIFSKNTNVENARESLKKWYAKVADAEFNSFNTLAATIYEHEDEILHFFINRSTNASAESFNSKIKRFRASLRGVVDLDFFLFRVSKIFA
jgi:transposase